MRSNFILECNQEKVVFRVWIIIGLLLFGVFTPSTLLAQETNGDVNISISTLYEIKLTRLQRKINKLTNRKILKSISELLNESEQLAGLGEYDLAIEFIDTALELAVENPIAQNTDTETNSFQFQNISKRIYSGTDIWQQRFGIVFTEKDCVLYENYQNMLWGAQFQYLLKYKNNTGKLDIDARLSQQYYSGYAQFINGNKYLKWRFDIENRFEGTWYYHYKDLRYLNNVTDVLLEYKFSPDLKLAIGEQVAVRKYTAETVYFSSFNQNKLGVNLFCSDENYGRLYLQSFLRTRKHQTKAENDYEELYFGLEIWPDWSSQLNGHLIAYTRSRDYRFGFNDSLFTNGFTDFYASMMMEGPIRGNIDIGVEAKAEIRKYQHYSRIFPSFREFFVNPYTQIDLLPNVSVKTGYFVQKREHFFHSSGNQEMAELEDFHSHGPSLVLDIISANGILLSLTGMFEFRRFPNASFSRFASIYSDRDIHTLFLFFNYVFYDHWELSATVTLDYDYDLNLEGADTKSNLFNIELGYEF